MANCRSSPESPACEPQPQGDRAFRILGGYDAIPVLVLGSIGSDQSIVRVNSIVESVKWRRGFVEVDYQSALNNQTAKLRCHQLIVTVPLGVLQPPNPGLGVIRFDPEPG